MIADKVFSIKFRKLATEYLPTFLRTDLLVAYIGVLITPLQGMYITFQQRRKENLKRMTHTCQKFSMQKVLNDTFDKVERRIRIVKAVQYEGVYLFTEGEDDWKFSKTQWLFGDEAPLYLFIDAELYSDFDFVVQIPDIGIHKDKLRAEIEYYMLQSKNYNIVTV